MKRTIVNLSPASPYNNGWGYQENLLPKYQVRLGFKVFLIVSDLEHSNNGLTKYSGPAFYDQDGVQVIRVAQREVINNRITRALSYVPVLSLLESIKPDMVFFHGLTSFTIKDVVKYKKRHPDVILVQDNHLDYEIGYKKTGVKSFLAKILYRPLVKRSIRYVDKVYGVTPSRREYAVDFFKVPREKTDVLVMGADDDQIDFSKRTAIRSEIRKKYGIAESSFLIVSGGKLELNKGINDLIGVVKQIKNTKLLLFGSIPEENDELKLFIDDKKIVYVGWIPANKVYDYFFAADLVVFPGRHSVLWEQACASKTPCVFADWEGMHHVDCGGNCLFFDRSHKSSLADCLTSLIGSEKYAKVKAASEGRATDKFMYSEIAKKSVELLLARVIKNKN